MAGFKTIEARCEPLRGIYATEELWVIETPGKQPLCDLEIGEVMEKLWEVEHLPTIEGRGQSRGSADAAPHRDEGTDEEPFV